MRQFNYQAYDREGKPVSGIIDAETLGQATRQLEKKGYQPKQIAPAQMAANPAKPEPKTLAGPEKKSFAATTKAIRLSQSQLVLFTEELSELLESGLQLEQALGAMENRKEFSQIRDVTASLRQSVREGMSFSVALKKASPSFDELYCSLVGAGEMAGALPKILKRQAEHLSAMEDLRSRVVQSLIYPSFIVFAGVVLMFFFMTFLVPQLTTLFTKTGQDLPIPTLLLIKISSFFKQFWPFIIGIVITGTGGFIAYIRTVRGKEWWDVVVLKLPLIGRILRAQAIAQIAQTLATLVGNGLPLMAGLRLVSQTCGNTQLKSNLLKAMEMVGDGQSFSKALTKTGSFPPMVIDSITIGEQTGELAIALERIAKRYDKELKRSIDAMTSMIQPVIIVVLSLLVGLVAYSIITGIFQSISGLRVKG